MAATSPGGGAYGALCGGSTSGGPGAGPGPGPGGSAGSQQRTVVSVSAGQEVVGVSMQSVHSSINYSKVCFALLFAFCYVCFDFAFCFLSFF